MRSHRTRTPRRTAAILVFTRGPCVESERKRLPAGGAGPELLGRVLQRVLEQAAAVSDADVIVAAPACASLPRSGRFRRIDQRGESFGERLQHAVAATFALGYRRVVAIGDDAPEIAAADLRQALDAVSAPGRRAALGPCADGGFYLLGLSEFETAAFRDVPWRSARTAAIIGRRLRAAGFCTSRLRPLADIDDRRSLELVFGRLRRTLPALAALIGGLLRAACAPVRLARLELPLPVRPLPVPALRGPPAAARR